MVPESESSEDDGDVKFDPLPEASALASWIDTFKMSTRSIEATYTKSEIAIICWHSKVQEYNFNLKRVNKPSLNQDGKLLEMPTGSSLNPNGIVETEKSYIMPSDINNGVAIPKVFFDEDGNMDLRKATGPQAATYLRHIGINLVVPHLA